MHDPLLPIRLADDEAQLHVAAKPDEQPLVSRDVFLADVRTINNTIKGAGLVVGRGLNKIQDERSYAWDYYSLNDFLKATFGKASRGKQLMAYARMVDDALEEAVQLGLEDLPSAELELHRRLPTEGHLRALRQYHGRETTVSMLAQSIADGTPLPHPQEHRTAAALPPPPLPPTRRELKRLSRDALVGGLETFTNVDTHISRAMILNIDLDLTLAQIEEAMATLEAIRDQLLEHGGGR